VRAYLNGKFLARSAAVISVDDRGFIFGDGVYEVWRVVNGRLFEAERHAARLASGLRELRIELYEPLTVAAIETIANQLLRDSDLTHGEATLYVQVTRGAAPRVHQFPPAGTAPTVFATVNRLNPPEDLRARGASVITLPDTRWLRCDIKSLQLLPNVLAKQAAVERGALDALFIRDAAITEGSHTNVLGVLDGVIRTHPANNLILPGVTRAIVLDLARGLGIPVSETALAETDIQRLEELFLVGTTTDVMPIIRVNDRPVATGAPGPVTSRLGREFRAYLDASCQVAHASR
jgi:D-alanine transaminase